MQRHPRPIFTLDESLHDRPREDLDAKAYTLTVAFPQSGLKATACTAHLNPKRTPAVTPAARFIEYVRHWLVAD